MRKNVYNYVNVVILKKYTIMGCDFLKIVLASASERRQELLNRLVENFTIIVSEFDESLVEFQGDLSEYVENIALGKAKDVVDKVKQDAIIIAADTIVTLENDILGKPKDKDDAFRMLKMLSGRVHKVYSGLVLINTSNGRVIKTSLATEVKFSSLTDEEIIKYINSGEPLDKAGAYGIQGKGGIFVEEIRGCYYNVVGLPLNKLKYMLNEII